MREACSKSGLATDRTSKTLQQGATTGTQERKPDSQNILCGRAKRSARFLPLRRFLENDFKLEYRGASISIALSLSNSPFLVTTFICPPLRSAPPHVRHSPTYAFSFLTARPPTWITLHVNKHRSSIDLFQIDILSITCKQLILHSSCLASPDPNPSPNPPRLIVKTEHHKSNNTKK